MNYRRATKISGGLLLIFLILILMVNRADLAEAGGAEEMEEVQLIDEQVSEIAAVALNHGDIRFGLIHRPSGILLEPPLPGAELSQEEMRSFLYRLSKLKTLGTITRREELAAYGLDPPRSLVTLIMKDGKKIRLALGDVSPVGDSSYLLREGIDEIFLLSEADSRLLSALPDDFRDRRVLPHIELGELNLIREISLDFDSEEHEDFTIANSSEFEFRLTEPFVNTLDYESVLTDMIFPLISLNPERVADIRELPPTQGFRLSLLLGEERFNLSFREGEESFFILREDLQRVFEIPKEDVPWGNLSYRDLLKESVYHVNISRIDSIQVRDGEKLYTLELSGGTTELEGNLNGTRIEYPEVMELYQALFSTGIADIVHGTSAAGIADTTAPDFSITVFKKNGVIDTLEFYSKDREELFVAVNGEIHFTTYSRIIQALRRKVSSTAS
jgi:Domain of unknown function (DUF4340)